MNHNPEALHRSLYASASRTLSYGQNKDDPAWRSRVLDKLNSQVCRKSLPRLRKCGSNGAKPKKNLMKRVFVLKASRGTGYPAIFLSRPAPSVLLS